MKNCVQGLGKKGRACDCAAKVENLHPLQVSVETTSDISPHDHICDVYSRTKVALNTLMLEDEKFCVLWLTIWLYYDWSTWSLNSKLLCYHGPGFILHLTCCGHKLVTVHRAGSVHQEWTSHVDKWVSRHNHLHIRVGSSVNQSPILCVAVRNDL